MIRINLLPDGGRKRGKVKAGAPAAAAAPPGGAAGNLLIAAAAIVLFGAGGYVGWSTFSEVSAAKSEKLAKETTLKQTLDKIEKSSEKARELKHKMEVFAGQLKVLKALAPDDRILWSEKINMLSRLIPPEVFLTQIEVTEQKRAETAPADRKKIQDWEGGGKKGPKPKVNTIPVVTYTLRLVGLATGKDPVAQLENVGKFHEALVKHETTDAQGRKRRFMDYFEPEIQFEAVEAVLFEKKFPVNQFVFVLRSKPLGNVIEELKAEEKRVAEEAAAAEAAAAKAKASKKKA